jgi:hypothetical protein
MGEIWTVKGRERERVSAAERAVVTQQRRKLLGKSMPRQFHSRRGMCASGAFDPQHVRVALQLPPPFRRTPGPTKTDRAYSQPSALLRKQHSNFHWIKAGQDHFYWRNPVIFLTLVAAGDDVLRNWGHEWRSMMRLLTLALGAVLFALAAAPSANAWVRPEWVVVRWANADCKIWHNDTNAPVGYGWRPVAFAGTWGGAYWKMGRLYQMHVCV